MTIRPVFLHILLVVVVLALTLTIGQNLATGYQFQQRRAQLPLQVSVQEGDLPRQEIAPGTSEFLLILSDQCAQLDLILAQYETEYLAEGGNRYVLTIEGGYQGITALLNWLEAEAYLQKIEGFDLQGQDKMVRIDSSHTKCELSMVIGY